MTTVIVMLATTVIVMLAFAATGGVQARYANYRHRDFHAAYAGPMYSSTPSVESGEFVPGRGIVGESCDLPTSACPNDERISN
jgi:hypothetical protein